MDFQDQFNKAIESYSTKNMFTASNVPVHSHTGADSVKVNYNNLENRTRFVVCRIVEATTNTAVANVVGGDFTMPFVGHVVSVGATVDTAGTTNTTTIDVNKNGTSIMKTKITIDSSEKTSRTAATLPIVEPTYQNFNVGDIFTFDVDAISSTAAKGLTIFMNVIDTTS